VDNPLFGSIGVVPGPYYYRRRSCNCRAYWWITK